MDRSYPSSELRSPAYTRHKALKGTFSISLENLEDWDATEQRNNKPKEAAHKRLYNKYKMAYFSHSLRHPNRPKLINSHISVQLENSESTGATSKMMTKFSSTKSKDNNKKRLCSSQDKKEKSLISRYHSLNPLLFSPYSGNLSLSLKPSACSSNLTSEKIGNNRMSTSMSNIVAPLDKKFKKSSPTRPNHAPSAPTSPSRSSLRVFTRDKCSTANNSPNSSLNSSTICFETCSPTASTPISDPQNSASVDTPSVSPIRACETKQLKSGIDDGISRGMGTSLSSSSVGDTSNKVLPKSNFVLPTLLIDKPLSNEPYSRNARAVPKRIPSMIGTRRFPQGQENAGFQDHAAFPSGHPGARWKLWKQKTCPDLLKTRSSDNLFR